MDKAKKYSIGVDFTASDIVKCPVCGYECVHPEGVVVNAGGAITIIESETPWTIYGEPTGRGVSIWLHFACEEGHRWTIRYQFHKGNTFKELVIDVPYNTTDWRGPKTIWRD